jgi:methylmalonyl-CoA carboxyltransferase small subunit
MAYEVEVEEIGEVPLTEPGSTIQSSVLPNPARTDISSEFDESKVCRSPLAGVVARVHVQPGQNEKANDLLLVIDAMKMEIKIAAQSPGTVKTIEVAHGNTVRPGQILMLFE